VEASHGFLTVEDVDWYEQVVSRHLPHLQDVRVTETVDDEPIGFIAQDAGEIHLLFVAPSAQGSGVGAALLDDVAEEHAELRVEVNEANPTAGTFYLAKGFEQIGRSELDGFTDDNPQ